MESLSWSDSFTSHIICFKHSSQENSRKIESSDNLDARWYKAMLISDISVSTYSIVHKFYGLP